MRPVWRGTISFGLVNIPVTLSSAEQRVDLKFYMLDSRDQHKIRYERVNEETGEEVPWDQIVKAYEYKDDHYVVVTDEDFQKADPQASKSIEIEAFIDREELDPMYLERPYYIVPAKGAQKAYALLREALQQSGKIGIARVIIRTRAYLAALFPGEEAIVLNLLRFAQELKQPQDVGIPKADPVSDKELSLALSLIDTMSAKWDPKSYHDEYRQALLERIEKKIQREDKEDPVPEKQEPSLESGKVIDIMDLLKQSVQRQKRAK